MATLTQANLTALKAAFLADAPTVALINTQSLSEIAILWSQKASPDFTVWRTDVTADETGDAWQGTDIDSMSALNMQRLQLLLQSSQAGIFDMSRADRRAGFENPFGTNQNNASRVAMRAAWKRFANRAEKVCASGTGSDASPAVMTAQGALTAQNVEDVLIKG